jgi:arginyl-tRNA synthetase
LWLLASQTSNAIHESIAQSEPAYVAKFAFQLAQQFNNFYHRHHILRESDPERQKFLLRTTAVVRRELVRVLNVLGMSVPPIM